MAGRSAKEHPAIDQKCKASRPPTGALTVICGRMDHASGHRTVCAYDVGGLRTASFLQGLDWRSWSGLVCIFLMPPDGEGVSSRRVASYIIPLELIRSASGARSSPPRSRAAAPRPCPKAQGDAIRRRPAQACPRVSPAYGQGRPALEAITNDADTGGASRSFWQGRTLALAEANAAASPSGR